MNNSNIITRKLKNSPTLLLSLSFSLPVLLGFTSCDHKDLCFDHTHNIETEIVFDWRNAPDAHPSSMVVVMFDPDQKKDEIRYILSGRDGGTIDLPFGKYNSLALNADLNDWANLRNLGDIETAEIYTNDAQELTAYNLMSASVPKVRGTEDERMAATPGMAWSARTDSVKLDVNDTHKVITLYPDEIVCHYTVEILDVENLQNARGEIIDGTLSGMAEGFLHGKKKSTDTPVTMPFTLAIDNENKGLKGEFLTFGECCDTQRQHILTIYLFLSDGSKWYYSFDVTDQVHKAPDPHHVNIIVRGLTLPRPLQSDAGLHPDVNDWQTETVDISM